MGENNYCVNWVEWVVTTPWCRFLLSSDIWPTLEQQQKLQFELKLQNKFICTVEH